MRRLFFLSFLFIIFNSITFSYCSAAQRCQCPDGTVVQYGQNCPVESSPPRVFGAVSVDPITREFGAVWNYSNSNSAEYDAKIICKKNSNSNRCITTWSSFYYTAVAISSDNKVVKFGTSDSYQSAWDKALKDCNKTGGIECEVAIMTSSSSAPDRKLWGAIAYDPVTGERGVSWSSHTQKEAFNAAIQACGKAECQAAGFQSKYAAMAKDSGKNLKMGYSNKNMKEAEQEALKACKKAFKVKSCEIVIEGMSEENIFQRR